MEPWVGSDRRPEQLDLAALAAVAKRRWWALLAGALAGVLVVAVGGSAGGGYQASASLLVGPIGGQYSALRAASQQGQTYADVATSDPVLQAARARLGPSAPPATVSADADFLTRVLTIKAQARTPAAAAATVAAVSLVLRQTTHVPTRGGPGQLTVLGPAQLTPAASAGRRKTLAGIAALAGLLAALTLAALVDRARLRHGEAVARLA